MESEIKALEDNGTWELVEAPEESSVIDCRWVYKIKKNIDGSVKYKARLVARGFSQIYGENYWETYAPVVKSSSIRMLLACAVEYDFLVGQIDVRNAYVKSELKEIVYMRQPYGFEKAPGLVCKLIKSLYGLKQAGHEWGKCLSEFLTSELKFRRLKSDPCVYVKGIGVVRLIISVYVDDLLIFSPSQSAINDIKQRIHDRFEIEDLGDCNKIIGIEVVRENGSIMIRQREFIHEMLRMYQMEDCKTEKTPLNVSLELSCGMQNCDNCKLANERAYRGIIGRLLYVAGSTRPDIAFAVSSLSRFNQKPHDMHMQAARRVLRYLKGTIDLGIKYTKTGKQLFAHSDADYANCKLDRKSYTGYIVVLAGGPVSWEARKQPTVALSTTEAEYMAITSAAREIMFCRQVLSEVEFAGRCEGATVLYSDSLGAIKSALKCGFSSRMKHIDVRHHYIRELVVDEKIVELEHVRTEEMMADICTKGLGPIKNEMNLKRLLY